MLLSERLVHPERKDGTKSGATGGCGEPKEHEKRCFTRKPRMSRLTKFTPSRFSWSSNSAKFIWSPGKFPFIL